MEESLLLKNNIHEEQRDINGDIEIENKIVVTLWNWKVFFEEVKRLGFLGGPLVIVVLSQFLLQVISIMMVGHLGELALSSSAIAISLSGVTGFSVLMGMASGLETICGQAYGAKQYKKLGLQTYTAIFCLFLVCIPISLIWIFMGKILVFIGQDPQISHEAGKFIIWLIPALFAYAILQPLIRYFQTQSMITPMLITSFAILCFHIPLSWVLVFKFGLGNLGGALGISISYWLNAIIFGFYIKFSPSCEKTRTSISIEIFYGIREFFRLAIPSAVMSCTRVANELGAGNPQGARIATFAAMFIAIVETSIVTTTLFMCRDVFGYTFSNEKEVASMAKERLFGDTSKKGLED
ncbi:hypothetical protein CsatB_021931 [Cannabis sativa]